MPDPKSNVEYCFELLESGKLGDALDSIGKLIEDDNSGNELAVRLLETSGRWTQQDRSCDVLDVLEFVTRLPNDDYASEAHYRRAILYRQQGLSDEAVRETVFCLARADHWIGFEMNASFSSDEELAALRKYLPILEEVAKQQTDRDKYFYISISDALVKIHAYERSGIYLARVRDLEFHGDCSSVQLETASGEGLVPSALILGAMKCGTTMLFESILHHPTVATAIRKEINFLEDGNAGFSWYLNHFVRRDLANGRIAVDASVSTYAHEVHDRVEKYMPDAKFIFLARDPSRRAISHYFHIARHGHHGSPIEKFYDIGRFADLISKTDDELESALYDLTMFRKQGNVAIAFGFYYHFLRRWVRRFGREKFLVLTLRELHDQPQNTFNKVFRFLGVEESGSENKIRIPQADHYAGNYSLESPDVARVRQQLGELYADSKQKFESEFGVEIGDR